jgi:hypothetical protein
MASAYLIASQITRTGLDFFNSGRDVVLLLGEIAVEIRNGDASDIKPHLSETFTGHKLGLTHMALTGQRDGIRLYSFQSDGPTGNRKEAVAEWQTYVDGFVSIETVGLHLHRLEEWGSNDKLVASIRYELIGTPIGESEPGIDRAFFRMGFERIDGNELKILWAELIEGERTINNTEHFTDVAAEAGIDFENRYYPPFLNEKLKFGMIRYGPGGITAADYDNDGFYDLFIPDGESSKLFRNGGNGAFDDVTAKAGLTGLDGVSVALFADYDNDGYKDLFVSRTFQPNQLFHNNGDGTFSDVTDRAGIGPDWCTTVASWGDYDNDGFLDLYVGRYLDPRDRIPTTFYARNGEPNQLYHNNGNGTFSNVTDVAGVGETGLCLGTVFGDYDNDGDLDLYVVNDFGRKTLYRNNGDLTFDDVTTETNTLAYGAGMSASFGDYNNDGWLDIYVAHIRSDEAWFAEEPTVFRYTLNSWLQGVWWTDMPLYLEIFKQSGFGFVKVFQDMAAGNVLLRNKGDGTFEDVSWNANANPPGWFWGSAFVDFDNDGWQDIYSVNGWVYNDKDTEIELEFLNNVVTKQDTYKTGIFFDPEHFGRESWHGWERNRYLRNNEDDTFKELGRATNTDLMLNSRGIAVADYWNRGVMDIAVAASTDRHALLRNNVGSKRNWLAVELVGGAGDLPDGSNRDAVGARATIIYNRPDGVARQFREVVLGDGYGSQNSLRLYFGLDKSTIVNELIVNWPRSNIEQRFTNIPANRIIQVQEGKDMWVEQNYTRH